MMKVGDLVFDTGTKEVVLIIGTDPTYEYQIEGRSERSSWDFEVMSKNSTYYADLEDLREIKK